MSTKCCVHALGEPGHSKVAGEDLELLIRKQWAGMRSPEENVWNAWGLELNLNQGIIMSEGHCRTQHSPGVKLLTVQTVPPIASENSKELRALRSELNR